MPTNFTIPTISRLRPAACTLAIGALLASCQSTPSAQPPSQQQPASTEAAPTSAALPAAAQTDTSKRAAPVYSPQDEQARFTLAEGYRIELVAAEPLVQDPIAIDFDPDGRMYVVEMRGYMPNLQGTGEDQPVGRIVVVEDTNDDGKMDRKTIFLDSLVLPRAVKVLEHGVLVAVTPNVWLVRDTNGDLRADTRELVRNDYGNPRSNPEHNANGLLWGMDNWLHNANYAGQFRVGSGGRLAYRATPSEGQWGVASDEYGRLYRNSNEDPLRADLIPSHYAQRNPGFASPRGVYERLTANVPVWPAHKTPAVNRGYRPQTLRPDSTLAHYTSAGSPTPYVGDRLPAELRRSVFITEPAGNLVGRMIIGESPDGTPTARTAYERAEFLTASDERFRPVNVATAPDGTLYVVDMYRGIIQHRAFITGYLEQQINARGMEQPIGLGRIWRVVHESTRRGERPQLSKKTPAELVPVLAHPNGWWRITAQRLLVERGDRSAAPALRQLFGSSTDDRARLHALWTLDGLGEADVATVGRALADSSQHVRAAAIRIAEPWLAQAAHPLARRLVAMVGDRAPTVRRQLAASLGELPITARDSILLQVLARHGDDPIVADAVVTGLAGRELQFLESLLASETVDARHQEPAIRSLATVVVSTRDAAKVQRLLMLASQRTRARAQRLALLAGARPSGQRGGQTVNLPQRPAGLIADMASADSALRTQAQRVAESLTWPGKTSTGPAVRPLNAAEQARFAAGQQQYVASCAGCHQVNGTGLEGVARPLVGSRYASGPALRLIRIVLHGKEGQMMMPPVGSTMTDDQIANVATYVRRAWGNTASPVEPNEVREARGATVGRNRPWTDAELGGINW